MTVTKKHSKCSVFAFGFETRIKTILPVISRLISEALLIADHVSITCCFSSVTSLTGFSSTCSCMSVSVGISRSLVWCSCSHEWMVHITVMSCCSNNCCQKSQAAGNFCFPAQHACTRALSCCDTRLWTSHQMWPPNRPDVSSVDYRLLRVIQKCVYQKQQGTSNIVDELWLLI